MPQLRFIEIHTSPTKRAFIAVDDIKAVRESEHKPGNATEVSRTVQIASRELGALTALNETLETLFAKIDAASGSRVIVIGTSPRGEPTDVRAVSG